ncbi:MAG: hypothetical protein WD013_04820 [Gemmatimonadota bacterium]
MTAAAPRVALIDPAAPLPPEALPAPVEDSGEVVVVLADADAREAGWTARLVVSLVSNWAEGGARVVLCDGNLDEALLHGELDVENQEGLGDVILFGASPRRVARKLDGRGFLFISSGTVVADPEAAYSHPRWRGLCAAFREAGAALVLYLPAESRGVPELSGLADRILRLTTAGPSSEPGPGEFVLHAEEIGFSTVAGSATATDPSDVLTTVFDIDRPAGATETSDASPEPAVEETGQGAIRTSAGSGIEVVTDEAGGAVGESVPDRSSAAVETETPAVLDRTSTPIGSRTPADATKAGNRMPWIVLAVLVLLGVLLVSAWYGIVPIPGLTPLPSTG